MALFTPEYQPTSESRRHQHLRAPSACSWRATTPPSTSATSWSWPEGLLRRPEVTARARPRHPGRLPAPARRPPSRWPPAAGHGPRHAPGLLHQGGFTTNPNNSHEDGAFAMARSMDPNSAGSCFSPGPSGTTWTPAIPRVRPDHRGRDVIGQLRASDIIESVVIENAAE